MNFIDHIYRHKTQIAQLADTNDVAHEALAYANDLVTSWEASHVTITENTADPPHDSDNIWEQISNCLHKGKLADDWLYVEVEGRLVEVQYGNHKTVYVVPKKYDTVGSVAEKVLFSLTTQAIRELDKLVSNNN